MCCARPRTRANVPSKSSSHGFDPGRMRRRQFANCRRRRSQSKRTRTRTRLRSMSFQNPISRARQRLTRCPVRFGGRRSSHSPRNDTKCSSPSVVRRTDKLRHVQDLLRHRLPGGDPAAIFDRALTLLLENLKKQKLAVTGRPRSSRSTTTRSRHVPAAVKRTVWARDGGRCRFEGPAGRCGETGRLEFHHVVPYACGGAPVAGNLELRCAAHNRYEAEQWFGVFVREEPLSYSAFASGSRALVGERISCKPPHRRLQ